MISEDRKSHFAHLLCDKLYDDDLVDYSDDSAALRAAKDGIDAFLNELESIDGFARAKITSLKRGVIEGSPEWDTMYKKYYEEEIQRRNKA